MSEGFLLSHVVNQGDLAACQALLNEGMVDVNAATPAGERCLHVAIRRGLSAMAELLLRFGADPRAASQPRCGQQTPLHLAVELDHGPCLQMLLAFGADPNAVDAQRQLPLHVAARLGHVASARVLVAHGSALADEDSLGRTPLRLAEASMKRSSGHAEIVTLLLSSIGSAHGAQALDALKVDAEAAAAAGGPLAALDAGHAIRVSGVPLLPPAAFAAESKHLDTTRIAWIHTVQRKK